MKRERNYWSASLIISVAIIAMPVAVAAATISQSFSTSTKILAGMVVSLDTSNKQVVPASISTTDTVVGIAASDGSSLLEVKNTNGGVQVVTTGEADVLASDLHGAIRAGDKLTTTYMNGIAAKASIHDSVIGVAESDADFNDNANTTRSLSVDSKTVKVSFVKVAITIPPQRGVPSNTANTALQQLADAVAGKQISIGRLIAAAAVIMFGFASVLAILYSSTHASILSIGRNPLARKVIQRSLVEVLLIGLAVVLLSQLAGFLILRL
jgi:hypothetical protein